MPTRERWIVYPLLFLTLGMVMRDKIVPPEPDRLDAGDVYCESLTIVGTTGQPRLRLGEVAGAGQMEVCGRSGQTVLVAGAASKGGAGFLEVSGADSRPRVQLAANSHGGMIGLLDKAGRVEVVLGHESDGFGLSGTFFDLNNLVIPLQIPTHWPDILRRVRPDVD